MEEPTRLAKGWAAFREEMRATHRAKKLSTPPAVRGIHLARDVAIGLVAVNLIHDLVGIARPHDGPSMNGSGNDNQP